MRFAMKLSDLIKDIRTMSEEELREHVRAIRHSKYVVKPKQQAKVKKEAKRTGNKAASKFDKLLAGMTEEQRAALIKQLGG